MLLPHFFAMWALGIAAMFVTIVAWWAVVITGKYPRGLWNFIVGVSRWQARIGAYMFGLTDEYPPFSLND